MSLIRDYVKSVIALANKLPQWSSDVQERRNQAALSSMFEEAGEISGLYSKYRTRINKQGIDLYNTSIKDIPQNLKNEIKDKFIDECADFLWVTVASAYSLNVLTEDEIVYNLSLISKLTKHDILFQSILNIFEELSMIRVYLYTTENKLLKGHFIDLFKKLDTLVSILRLEYNIKLDDLIKHNMSKLGYRYDSNGKRVDGKL